MPSCQSGYRLPPDVHFFRSQTVMTEAHEPATFGRVISACCALEPSVKKKSCFRFIQCSSRRKAEIGETTFRRIVVRRMKGFRHAVVAVVAAYVATYGVLVFIEYRLIKAPSDPGITRSSHPEEAWVFAALHATMIFGAIAVIGVLLAVLWFICECFRSRRRRVPSQLHDDVTSSA